MSDFYDRSGTPISMEQWCALLEGETEYRRVALTEVADAEVSTVWLGLDHGFGRRGEPGYRPLIFETMIFGGPHDSSCWRWPTEEDARAGHAMAVELAKLPADARYDG